LGMGESVHLGEVKLPEGVELASTVQESDLELSVASVLAPKKPQTVDDEEVDGEAVEGAEGEATEGGDSE
jgi:large subunit ribosomal protein L25